MTGAYADPAAIWPPIAAALFLVGLGLYSWRRRSVRGALPLAVSSLFGGLWLLGIAFETAAGAPAAKIGWQKFQAAWSLPAVTAATWFALEYAFPRRWLNRRWLAALAIPPLLTWALIVVNDGKFMWRALAISPEGARVEAYAPAGAVLVAYGLGLVLVNAAAFLWLFIRSPQHRWPVALMLVGMLAARGLFLSGPDLLPVPILSDPAVLSIVLVWTMYAIALFGFHILDPLPAARAAALAQMREGMVVFDAGWRVASLNPAAASMLATSMRRARGKTLAEIMPAFPDLSTRLANAAPGVVEVSLGGGAPCYALDISPLRDFHETPVGWLLLLRDVTEQRQAQAQILEHQWARAVLQEREQLAHELHDGLSQSLAFLNLQAQAAQVYLRADQAEVAQSSLARLAEVAREMQGDVRGLIGNLLAVSLPAEGFCSALRQAVARFEQQTGLAVALDIAGEAAAACSPARLSPATGVQLLRIVQEALMNVGKHADAPTQVHVRLAVEDGQVCLTIADSGAGFDPAQPPLGRRHFGLQVMRQRAERIGGQFAIQSNRGEGTRVEVRVPLAAAEQGAHDANPPG